MDAFALDRSYHNGLVNFCWTTRNSGAMSVRRGERPGEGAEVTPDRRPERRPDPKRKLVSCSAAAHPPECHHSAGFLSSSTSHPTTTLPLIP